MSSEAAQRLGDLVAIRRGSTYRSSLLNQDGPVLLGLSSIAPNGGFRRDSLKTYGGESPREITLGPGDLYVSLKDVTQSGDLLGAVARVPSDIPAGRLTQDTVRLIGKDGAAGDGDYIYWLLRTPEYRDYCRVHAIGVTTLALPREDFLAFPVPPRTRERKAIVRALRALDEKVEHNAHRQRDYATVRRLLFREQRSAGDWPERQLSSLIEHRPGKFLPAEKYIAMGEFLVFGSNSIMGRTDQLLCEGPLTVMARIGSNCGALRFSADACWVNNNASALVARTSVDPHIVHMALESLDFTSFRRGSGQPFVGVNDLLEASLPFPSEGGRLGDVLSRFFHLEAQLERESSRLSRVRDELLPKLVSGRIRVRDSYDADDALGAVADAAGVAS